MNDTPESLMDAARELAIEQAGLAVEKHMALAGREPESYFLHRGAADAARRRMEVLIQERSAGQVARMEQAQGLA